MSTVYTRRNSNMKCIFLVTFLGTACILGGCGTAGKNFYASKINSITNGVTTQAEIKIMFGKPFKTGIQNGQPVWIYEHSRYNLINSGLSKDLIIVFGPHGVVQSHQFMTSEPTS